jgi:hypothetical protein
MQFVLNKTEMAIVVLASIEMGMVIGAIVVLLLWS